MKFKSMKRTGLICVLFAIASCSDVPVSKNNTSSADVLAASQNPCEDTGSRFVFGQEPLASQFYEAAQKAEDGAWQDDSFFQESFHLLGKVNTANKELYVTYVNTTWGVSSCRRTKRLIFFTPEFKQYAQYYGIEKPELQGSLLVFPLVEGEQSIVDISEGLPEFLSDGYEPLEISYPEAS